ncbi:hypothetical protein KIN20_017787 [Parelaphostrongylus tenuis]|uniref:Uncharacterized protein n=1 Tax=Parelaphostrongylus tenuis TaxID=148309 RepID=A0AAD5N0C4_PARTN|nr:hypothetical protein KIN20_017787 [Parelaphostrongylus tenuis]
MDVESFPFTCEVTTNLIIAKCSKEMWQSVANRAIRMLALGRLATHFASAFAIGN